MIREQITAILYDISLVISGETDPQPLARNFVQRLLFHTGFSCGWLASYDPLSGAHRLACVIGNHALRQLEGQAVADWPAALHQGEAALLVDDVPLPPPLAADGARFQAALRLPIPDVGTLVLLARQVPTLAVPLTDVFTPVLLNFGRVYRLSCSNAAMAQQLRDNLAERERRLRDVHQALRLTEEQKILLEGVVEQRTRDLRDSQLQIVQRLGRAAEFRDNETGHHILRMSHMAALLARAIGWGPEECELMLHASPMHDLGKIGISDQILLKPGRLTEEERRIMETHTLIGGHILAGSRSDLLELAREIALTHHEKWDGTGYPNGLQGEAIPISGRITALADVFDALTSERPYKKAWSEDEACQYLREQAGKHFDPQLTQRFLGLIPQIREIQQRFNIPSPPVC